MDDSILLTIKKLIGLDQDYNAFDQDLIVSINGAFMILNQLGVGPLKPFMIFGANESWSDFSSDIDYVNLVKNYVYLRARLLFDPPNTGVLHEAMERQVTEFEWRLKIQAEALIDSDDQSPSDPVAPDEPKAPSEGTIDHTELINRDALDQHPISAITGLEKQVERIPHIMTAEDMRKILLS